MKEENGPQLELGQAAASDIESGGLKYKRLVIRTHYIEAGENIAAVAARYVKPHLVEGDIVFVSEKAVSVSQGNWLDESEVNPGWWATFLCRFVHKSPSGPGGVGSPEKMQLAIERVGFFRVLFAAVAAAVTKPFGVRGLFYKLVGPRVSSVDGQTGPEGWPARTKIIFPVANPETVARDIARAVGAPAIVADMNNISGTIKGYSHDNLTELDFVDILRDNPMGQMQNMTPIGIVRVVD